jgi:hypothetical protein
MRLTMTTTNEQLLERLGTVNTSLTELRDELRSKIRRRDFLTAVAILAAVIGIVIGALGWKEQRDAHASMMKSRTATCLQYNNQQDDAIVASGAHDLVLATILSPQPRTADANTKVSAALKQLHQADLDGHKHRNCTPTGIREYLDKES